MIVLLDTSTKGKFISNFTRNSVISPFDRILRHSVSTTFSFLTTFRCSLISWRINDFDTTILNCHTWSFRDYSLFSYLFLFTQCTAICRSQMQLSLLFFDNCKIARNSLKRNDEGYTREKLDLSSVISL